MRKPHGSHVADPIAALRAALVNGHRVLPAFGSWYCLLVGPVGDCFDGTMFESISGAARPRRQRRPIELAIGSHISTTPTRPDGFRRPRLHVHGGSGLHAVKCGSPRKRFRDNGGEVEVVAKDELAFSSFYTMTHPRLVGMLTRYTGEPELARDLAQETFARLWRDWPRVCLARSREAYAFGSARNLAKNHFRWASQRRYHPQFMRELGQAADSSHDLADALVVRAAVAALPFRQRAVLVLRFVADLSVEDTAAALGFPEGTVKTLTRRSLSDLRATLDGPALVGVGPPNGESSRPTTCSEPASACQSSRDE